MALLIGAALGVSGAIFQALTRNPLGSPDIIGLEFGAYTGLTVIAGIGGGYYAVAAGALVGGLVTAVVVYALSYRDGVAGYRLIIVGIAVGAVVNSVNQWIIIKVDYHTAVTASVCAGARLVSADLGTGGADDGVPGHRGGGAGGARPLLPVLQMGDDAAGLLGVRPELARLVYLVIGVALVAPNARRPGRSHSSRWPRRRSPAGSPPVPVSAWCRRPRWARCCSRSATSSPSSCSAATSSGGCGDGNAGGMYLLYLLCHTGAKVIPR